MAASPRNRSGDSPGDALTIALRENGLEGEFPEIENLLAAREPDAHDEAELEPEDLAARDLYRQHHEAHGLQGAFDSLDSLHDRFEAAADALDGTPAWERLERVRGVVLEAIAFSEDASLRWAEGEDDAADDLPLHPPGWRPEDAQAAIAHVDEVPDTSWGRAMTGELTAEDHQTIADERAARDARAQQARAHAQKAQAQGVTPGLDSLPWFARGAQQHRADVTAARAADRAKVSRAPAAARMARPVARERRDSGGHRSTRSSSRSGDSGDGSGSSRGASEGGDDDPPPPSEAPEKPLAGPSPRFSRPWRPLTERRFHDALARLPRRPPP